MPVTSRLTIYAFTSVFLLTSLINASSIHKTTTTIDLNLLTEKNQTDLSISNNVEDILVNSKTLNSEITRQLAEDEDYYWPEEIFFANYSDEVNRTTLLEEYINKYVKPKAWMWILIFLHSMVFVVGLLGNLLVCVAVYRNHSMRTVTNYFIVNLAVADALVLVFCLPFSVVWDVTSTWWFGTVMCKVVLYSQSVSVTVSILTLTFISIDRWYAICFPLKFKSTTGKAKTAICIIWIIALVCEIPESVALRAKPFSKTYTYFTQCEPTWHPKTDIAFMIVKMVLFYWLPLLLICIAYTQVIRVLWKSGRASHQIISNQSESSHSDQSVNFVMNTNRSTEGQLRSRRNVAKMLVAVVAIFALCFFPVHLLSVLRLAIELSNSDVNRALSIVSHWLCYANSAANPIIYNFMSGKFRREFRSAFFKCSQVNRSNFRRTSTYIYRFSTTNNRSSERTKTEMI